MRKFCFIGLLIFLVIQASTSLAQTWKNAGPLEENEDSVCYLTHEKGVVFRIRKTIDRLEIGFFRLSQSALSDVKSPFLRVNMRVDQRYSYSGNGEIIDGGPDTPSFSISTSTIDDGFIDALEAGNFLYVNVSDKLEMGESFKNFDARYSLRGSKRNLDILYACRAKLFQEGATAKRGPGKSLKIIQDSPVPKPSFDCQKARSTAEKLICGDDELALRDIELDLLYKEVLARIEGQTTAGDSHVSMSKIFKSHSDELWTWREKNCSDRDCLVRWYKRREAELTWMAHSEDGMGNGEVKSEQLQDGRVLFTYNMTTHSRNVLLEAGEKTIVLADGQISVISEAPFIYRAIGQKSYLSEQGAFWYDSVRTEAGSIIDIHSERDFESTSNIICFKKEEFLRKTSFTAQDLSLVDRDEICVSR